MTTPEPKRTGIPDGALRRWRRLGISQGGTYAEVIDEALARGQDLAEINGALKVLLALWEHGDPKVFDAKFYDVIAKYAK